MSALVPRQITWETIEKTSNLAALPLLAAGLASPSVEVRMRSLKTLLNRSEVESRRQILIGWEHFAEPEVELIGRNTIHFQAAALDLLKNGSTSQQLLVLRAIAQLQITGCVAAVLNFVTDPQHQLHAAASECLLDICMHWGKKARQEQDVPSVRGPLLETIYTSLLDFPKHRSYHVIDAWLALVHWDDSLQRGLLGDAGHVAFRAVVERLNATPNNPTQYRHLLQLLAGYLLRSTAPKSIHALVCEIADPQLAIELASMVDSPNWLALKRRLRELPKLACLETLETGFPQSNLLERKRLWFLMSVSSKEYGEVLRGAVQISKLGSAEARLAAAEIVKNCRKPELDEMVGDLQCALAGLAKSNSAGPALLEIAKWNQSASVPLKQAAQELFSKFTVENLIEQVSLWPTSMCKAMAHVVCLTNGEMTAYLVKELESPSPKRRLAALRATQMLSHSESVSQYLLPMLEDPRLEVRVRVIDLLSDLGGDMLEQLIPTWLNDVNTDIQEAAKRVVRRRERMKKSQSNELLQSES